MLMKATSSFKSYIAKSLLCIILLLGSILAFSQPVARFSAGLSTGCAPILVNFTDESTGSPNYWRWDLGNGTISYLQNPSVTYFNPGNYTIKLLVKNAAGQDSIVRTGYISVYAAPVVDFSSSQTSGCNTVSAAFTNLSNTANNWQWDFGDGIFSSETNPSHIYSQTGSYNVSLKAINQYGCSLTLVKPSYINVNNAAAGFAYTVPNRCQPSRLRFQNNSTGNGRLSYKWLFGNGDSSVERTPAYTYSSGGTYSVKLIVSNEFGCEDTAVSNITVDNAVSAAFTANIINSCKAPVAIHFTNQVLSNNNYSWSFGDTSFSSASNPVHIFNDTGKYTVKLVIRNSNGCSDSLIKTNYISIQKPFISFDNLPDSGCSGFNKRLSILPDGSDSVTNYLWNFGDGSTSTEASPAHIFSGDGYFTVSLISTGISGCRDTTVMQNAIHTGTKPMADFSANSLLSCAQTRIEFTDLTQGVVTQWQWNFGDNGHMFEQNPLYRFSDTGFLAVELIAFNGGCADTVTKPGYIYIKPSVAKMKFDFNCQNPSRFSFTNLAVGADSWLWNFGDGNTSTERHPVHIYSDTGSYIVELFTYNNTTGCDGYKSKSLMTTKALPDFYASDSVICKEGAATFTSTLRAEDVNRFFWYFGDGSFETTLENSVTHQYEQPGDYTVTLVVSNKVNCRDSVIKTNYISVKSVKAYFRIPVPVICTSTPAVFTDSSVAGSGNTIQSWQWNYGDGNTETLTTPPFTHTYAARGTYGVSLKVTDSYGCSAVFTPDIPVTVRQIYSQFWPTDTIKCTNSDIRFVCPYAEAGVSYSWDFGDNTFAATQMPRHQYQNEGLYRIKLKVTQSAGCTDSFELARPVRIENPVARFNISDSFRNCPPLIVQFTNESVNAIDEVWDFGDGTTINAHNPSHFYSYPGVYVASLTVKGAGGCTKTAQRTIIVKGPKGSLIYGPINFCKAPAVVTFRALTTDASSFVWDFNDGTTVNATDSIVSHSYTNAGLYVPKLMLVDNQGCRVPVTGLDSISFNRLSAQFHVADTNTCNNGQVLFTNTSSSDAAVTNYRWDFGDGSFADNIVNPVHRYQSEGTYYPWLKVRASSGCIDSFTTVLSVRIAPSPDVSVNSSANNGCVPLAVTFNGILNSTAIPVTNWQWDFGNGNTFTGQHPAAQTFLTSNNYPVTLTVTGSNGCKKTMVKNITVNPLPNIQINGNTSICKGGNTTLTASGASSWLWLSENGQLSCTSCASTLVSPLVTTNYILQGTSQYGCKAADTITVKVAQPFNISYNNAAKICNGSTIALPVNGADLFEWYPSAGLSNAHSSSPLASPAITTIYRVIAKDTSNCFSDTGFITVNVYTMPTLNAGDDKTITAGSSTELIPTVSSDVTEVQWSPTGGVFRNGDNTITIKPLVTTEYTAVAKNAAGCSVTDKIIVAVVNDDPTSGLFIPNTFSPNADGTNDIFYPRSAVSIKINRLRIMNREGVVVFEKTNFYTNNTSSGWDGTLRGTKLPIDVYIYGAEMTGRDGKPKVISGNVSLVR